MVLIGCLANALPYSSRMALQESVLQDSSLGTTHCVPTLCVPDVTTHDQISLVFLLCIRNGLGIRLAQMPTPYTTA